jgi:hypothetical protein
MKEMNAKRRTFLFLDKHNLGVLSTANDRPWGAAVYYAVDEDLTFYFLTRTGSKKYGDIQKRPYAAMTVVDDAKQTTVQAVGRITEVDIGPLYNQAFTKLAGIHPPGQHVWMPAVSDIHTGKSVLLMLTPEHVQLSIFSHNHASPGIHKVI